MSELDDAGLAELYRALLLPRLVEEKMLRLLRQGRLSKWFSGIGQEAIAVGVVAALEEPDFVLPLHRNLGVFTTRGVDLDRLLRQLLGREGGFTDGRDRSFHFGTLEHGIVGMISHLGAMLPVADGLALAGRLRGERRVVAVFSGDGGTSEGDFHEALNLAAVWRLPVDLPGGEQRLGAVDPDLRAVRLRRPGRPGRGLRDAGRGHRRQRRPRRHGGGGGGGRAGPPG